MRDIVIASSRGEGLEELIRQGHPSPQNVEVIYQSSATLSIIKSMALNLIRNSPTDDIHLYILGGYCNLTQVISSTRHSYGRTFKYQEVVFWEDPETAVPRVTNAIHDTFNALNKTHIKPIFCTIPPAFLNIWNKTRLRQHKTSILKHTDKYDNMNLRLMDSCIRINKEIIRLNATHNAFTPKLADTVILKQGKHKGYKKFEHALEDGVHASDNTKQLWAGLILDAIMRNRGWKAPKPTILAEVPAQTDSDSESDQRQPQKRCKFTSERKL